MASLSVLALTLVSQNASARASVAPRAVAVTPQTMARAPTAQAFRHVRRGGIGPYWPAAGGYGYGYGYGASGPDALAAAEPPASADVNYTYKYDVPWDWAHRYPPAVVPSDRPYVSSCSNQPVTVPGRGGREQIVNVTRCY